MADLKENLGLGILAAVAEQRGHETQLVAFHDVSGITLTVERALESTPELIGLSIRFHHCAHEVLLLAHKLRQAGFRAQLTAGGQFPTLAYREVLGPESGVDSVVLHDGEETSVDLLGALSQGRALDSVAGLALRTEARLAFRTEARRLLNDLGAVPFRRRYRAHHRHMGVPSFPSSAAGAAGQVQPLFHHRLLRGRHRVGRRPRAAPGLPRTAPRRWPSCSTAPRDEASFAFATTTSSSRARSSRSLIRRVYPYLENVLRCPCGGVEGSRAISSSPQR